MKRCLLVRHYETHQVPQVIPDYLDGIVWAGPNDERVRDRLEGWQARGFKVWRYLMIWTYPLPDWNDTWVDIIRRSVPILKAADGSIPTTPRAWPDYGGRPFWGWPEMNHTQTLADEFKAQHFAPFGKFLDMAWAGPRSWMYEPSGPGANAFSPLAILQWRANVHRFVAELAPCCCNASLYGVPEHSFRDFPGDLQPANFYEAAGPGGPMALGATYYPPTEFTEGSIVSVNGYDGLALEWGMRRWLAAGGYLSIRLGTADELEAAFAEAHRRRGEGRR